MHILSHRRLVTVVSHRRTFTYIDSKGKETGSGCSFECDEHGVVDLSKLHECAQENYLNALQGINLTLVDVAYRVEGEDYVPIYCTGRWKTQTVHDHGVVTSEHTYPEPAVGRCECGRKVHLASFTNTCECNRDYNMSGQLLANRSQWGEETGESLSDILSI